MGGWFTCLCPDYQTLLSFIPCIPRHAFPVAPYWHFHKLPSFFFANVAKLLSFSFDLNRPKVKQYCYSRIRPQLCMSNNWFVDLTIYQMSSSIYFYHEKLILPVNPYIWMTGKNIKSICFLANPKWPHILFQSWPYLYQGSNKVKRVFGVLRYKRGKSTSSHRNFYRGKHIICKNRVKFSWI